MLGNSEYKEIFAYVKAFLLPVDGIATKSSPLPFRLRSEHTWRVFAWARRIVECVRGQADEEALFIAALFHDVGYARSADGAAHAANSAAIFREWADGDGQQANLSRERKDFIASLIANHSSKALLDSKDTPLELVLLMEADLLDETGAMSIAWDCLAEGALPDQSFYKTYCRMRANSHKVHGKNPMATPLAKAYWAEKQELASMFISQFARDIAADDEMAGLEM